MLFKQTSVTIWQTLFLLLYTAVKPGFYSRNAVMGRCDCLHTMLVCGLGRRAPIEAELHEPEASSVEGALAPWS